MFAGKHPLDTYKQSLLNLYIETLSECLEGPLKLTLIRGLSEMTSAISFLNEVELLSVAQSLAQDFVIEQQSTISYVYLDITFRILTVCDTAYPYFYQYCRSAYKNLLSNISKARPYAMLPLLSKIMSSIESGTVVVIFTCRIC